jgi:hypothetical protein
MSTATYGGRSGVMTTIPPHATGHERAKDGTLLRVDSEGGIGWVATHYDLGLRVIRLAEKSLGPNGQLGQRHSRSSRSPHRRFEKSVTIAGDATVVARVEPVRPCAADESVVRNGH